MNLNGEFWNANPDSKSGLMQQNKHGKSLEKIEAELIKLIDKNLEKGVPALLGGNSIHVDRRFIIAQMPKLDSRLKYRMLDVSAWKVVFESKLNKNFRKPDAHRALDDIRGSIAELQYYLGMINK